MEGFTTVVFKGERTGHTDGQGNEESQNRSSHWRIQNISYIKQGERKGVEVYNLKYLQGR